MGFKINIDASDLDGLEEIPNIASKALQEAGNDLAAATRAHIIEEANKKLHSRREMFVESLSHFKVDENTWVVQLEAKARWIDEGLSPHDMKSDLLNPHNQNESKNGVKGKGVQISKEGFSYRVIPFKHNLGPTQSTPAQQTLLDTIKKELKSRNIPYGKKEVDASGQAKLGKLHSFSIMNSPVKTKQGPGTGKGPIGSVMQGPTGIPLLQGISVYQNKVKDKQGKEYVRRDIMTFRVVSSKQGAGRWFHPGLEGTGLMDDGLQWAKDQWEKEIGPRVLADMIASIN